MIHNAKAFKLVIFGERLEEACTLRFISALLVETHSTQVSVPLVPFAFKFDQSGVSILISNNGFAGYSPRARYFRALSRD